MLYDPIGEKLPYLIFLYLFSSGELKQQCEKVTNRFELETRLWREEKDQANRTIRDLNSKIIQVQANRTFRELNSQDSPGTGQQNL
jgi:hypothetical protein